MKTTAAQFDGYEVDLFGKRFFYFATKELADLFFQKISAIYPQAKRFGSSVEIEL
jgi:hypothetical protein